MSLGQQLVQDLMQLGGAELPLTVQVSGEGRSVCATFSHWSPLAVGVEVIEVEGQQTLGSLAELAEQMARRLNYLSEPIRVLEVDAISMEAELRSDPPKSIVDGVEYFEVVIARDDAVWLHRYRNTLDGPRVSVPFTLTLETLARVVDDMAAP